MINMVITTAGRNAIVNAKQTGLNAVTIASIAVGSGKYTPTASATKLLSETKRVNIVEGGSNGDNSIHVAYRDDSNASYSIYEFGLILEDGTLFAVYSSSQMLLQKTANSVAFLAVDVAFDDIDVKDITFGEVSFTTAAATTENAGVVVIATDDEVSGGLDAHKVLTTKNIKALAAGEGKAGLVKMASDDEAMGGVNNESAVTPKQLQSKILSYKATNEETQVGAVDNKFVTPQGLRSTKASESQLGVVRFAGNAQAVAGTSDDVAMSPKTVKASIDANTKEGTQSQKGIVQLAPDSAAVSGTSTALAVTPSGLSAAIKNKMKDVEIDTASRVANSGGIGSFSLYPSGVSVQHQERVGTNQFAMVRYSDDDAGNSIVFFKSRASAARKSKSLLSGDKIGWISFLADNGNIKYGETLQGARAAVISGGVFESSSITSAGTTNLGVRGFIRLLACSDDNSRDGKGLEIIDNAVRPSVDNNSNLGTAGRRWKTIYAISDVIATSDEKYKQDIEALAGTKDVALAMVDLLKKFRFKLEVEEDGDNAPHYVGIVAQELKALLEANGLYNLAMIKSDTDENGETVLGVRYRDLYAFIINGLTQYMKELDAKKVSAENFKSGLKRIKRYAWKVPDQPGCDEFIMYSSNETLNIGEELFDANGEKFITYNKDSGFGFTNHKLVADLGNGQYGFEAYADDGFPMPMIGMRYEDGDIIVKDLIIDEEYLAMKFTTLEKLDEELNNAKPLVINYGDENYTYESIKAIIQNGREVLIKCQVDTGASGKIHYAYARFASEFEGFYLSFSCSYPKFQSGGSLLPQRFQCAIFKNGTHSSFSNNWGMIQEIDR